jgi:hypothetical protein
LTALRQTDTHVTNAAAPKVAQQDNLRSFNEGSLGLDGLNERSLMKKLALGAAILAVICSVNTVDGQGSPAAASSPASASPAPRPEVYTVTFIHGAAGKIKELEDWAKKSPAGATVPGHAMVLRHEAGSPWDYVAIEHVGAKATVQASGNPQGVALRPLMDWHDDTICNGPAWAEFAKAMNLDESSGKPKSNEDVYVISVYRPVVGQDDALDRFLNEPPSASGDLAVGSIVLQHLEGGPWRFLSISRYKNYQDYAKSEAASVAQVAKGSGGWFRLRDLVSFHNDTIAVHLGP